MDALRQHVVALLKGGQAYGTFDEIVADFAVEELGLVPKGAERSPWQIVDHMRTALRDILDFSQNETGTYVERKWTDEYWPDRPTPEPGAWEQTIAAYLEDVAELEGLIGDPNRDLFAVFPWGDGQSLLREALLAADHAAYHLGQLVELRRWIDAGPIREM